MSVHVLWMHGGLQCLRQNATLSAGQHAQFIAQPGDDIDAALNGFVVANCLCRILARRSSYVRGSNGAHILAFCGASVEAGPGSVVFARQGSIVDALEGSTVYAVDFVFLRSAPGAKIIKSAGEIDLWSQCLRQGSLPANNRAIRSKRTRAAN